MANDRMPSTPLVGRRRELQQLLSHAGVTDVDARDAVLLGGDAGIGKTRLLRELALRATAAKHLVLAGHCLDLGDSSLPYQPFANAFARLDDAQRDQLADQFPALGPLLPWPSPAPTSAVERSELFASVVAGLDALAAEQPVLLVIEDAHWADASTRHLIRYVLAQGFRRSVHVVISYRADDLHRRHPLRQAIAEWVRLPGVRRIELEPLADADVADLVRLRAADALPPEEVRSVVQRAAGNAFYVEELLDAGRCDHGAALPETLADLLLVRLDRLDDQTRRLVRAGSVTDGREGFAALAAAAELTEVELDAALGAAVDHKVLRRSGADDYGFRHALLGEAIRDDLLPAERRRIHAAFLAALDDAAPAATVARHALAAGELDIAFDATVRAAREAGNVAGYDEAAQHYERALALIGSAPPDTDEIELVIAASQALTTSGQLMRALELLRDHDRQLADSHHLGHGRLLVAIGDTSYFASLDVEAEAASRQAVEVVPDEPTVLRAEAACLRARVLSNSRQVDEAVAWGERALSIGEQIGADHVIADAKATLTRLMVRSDVDPARAELAFREVIAGARASGHVLGELRGLHQLGFVHYNSGALAEAAETFAENMRRAEQTGWAWGPYGFDGRFFGALVAYVRGDWQRTLELCAISPTAPDHAVAGMAAIKLLVSAGRGDTSQLEAAVAMRAKWRGDEAFAIHSTSALIELHGARADLAAARNAYDEVVQLHATTWDMPDFPAMIALAARLVGQYAAAARSLDRSAREQLVAQVPELAATVAQVDQGWGPLGAEGGAWTARFEAEVAQLQWAVGQAGTSPEAPDLAASWQRAHQAFSQLDAPYELARCAVRWAAALPPAQRSEAAHLLGQARETAERLGAVPLLAEIAAAAAGEVSSRSAVDLTPREHEVLQHVAAGRSNGEIGTVLFISTKTVSVHVSNILAKLGAASRTEAAAIARQRGLIDA